MVMYGTTMFLVQVADAPVRHPALWATRGVAPGSFTTAAGMATSGAITAWLRDLVGADYGDVDRRGRRRPAGQPAGCSCCPTSPASARRSSTPTPAAWCSG